MNANTFIHEVLCIADVLGCVVVSYYRQKLMNEMWDLYAACSW